MDEEGQEGSTGEKLEGTLATAWSEDAINRADTEDAGSCLPLTQPVMGGPQVRG